MLTKAQGRLYSVNACSVKLHGFETCPIKEKYMIRLVRTNERMVQQKCSVIVHDSISAEELKTRLTLKSIKEGLENRKVWSSTKEGKAWSIVNAKPSKLLVVCLEGKPEWK